MSDGNPTSAARDVDRPAGITRGRPPVGAARGESPVAKGRVTPKEFAELKAIMNESGRSQAELVRRGVQLVIQEHRATHAGDGSAGTGGQESPA